jgi:starvation-inducible outer membrane lipoprotein
VDFRGQLVTVVGPISGTVDGKIGNTPYKFMLMQVTGYKRWHITQQIVMPPQPIDPWFSVRVAGLTVAMAMGLVQSRPGTGSDHSNRVTLCFIGKRNSGLSAVSALTWI